MKKFFLISVALIFSTLLGCADPSIFVSIPLTTNPPVLASPISFVINATTARGYLVNSNNSVIYSNGSVIIFDMTNPTDPTALAAVSIPSFSGQVILDSTRGYLYIPNRLSDDREDNDDQIVRVNIDEASSSYLTVETFGSGSNPFGAAFDSSDALFVAGTGAVFRYDVDDPTGYSKVTTSFTTNEGDAVSGSQTREVALRSGSDNLYVTNRSDQLMILSVSEFTAPSANTITDLGTGPVQYVISGTASTRGLAVDATNSDIYVVEGGNAPILKVLNDASLSANSGAPIEINAGTLLIGSVPVGSDPSEIALDITNNRVYVANTGNDSISVIDTNLLVEVARISVATDLPSGIAAGDEPFGLALASLGGTTYIYVTNLVTHNVTIINTSTLAIVGNIP